MWLASCLDSQRVEATEAFGNTSHTIPGSSFTGRPQAAQQAFKSSIDTKPLMFRDAQAVAQRHATEPSQLRSMRTKLKNQATARFN